MKEDAQLLGELSRLIDRYGAEHFARLASILRNPADASALATVLEGALDVHSRSKRRRRRGIGTLPGSRILDGLRENEPEKYQVLSSFRNDLVGSKIFPSFRHVRRFADEHGIMLGSASSREKAVTPLLRFMAALPLTEMQALVAESAREVDDRSLARWSEVIMGSRPKPPSS